MLNTVKNSTGARYTGALLLFISCFTFQTNVSADLKANTAEEYRVLGYEEQKKGNINEALSYYTKAANLGINNAVLFNDMGVLYEEIDFISRAEHYYKMAIQNDAQFLPPYINLGYLYQRIGRSDEAATFFKMRYEMGDPEDPWAQKAKNELIKLKPEYLSWIQSLEAESLNDKLVQLRQEEFVQKVEKSQEHYYRGEKLFDEGALDDAMAEYNKALQYAPGDQRVIEARKKIILEQAKAKVREQAEQAIQRLETGDTVSARHDIQKILTSIPEEPILISR